MRLFILFFLFGSAFVADLKSKKYCNKIKDEYLPIRYFFLMILELNGLLYLLILHITPNKNNYDVLNDGNENTKR